MTRPAEPTRLRRYSGRAFPAYAYRPGRNPHPTRDPDGHSHGTSEEISAVDAQDWMRSPAWYYGIDLFNHGYYWEAHEAWEDIWRQLGRHSDAGRAVQGLIQLAVSLLKHELGQGRGAGLLLADARDKLAGDRLPGIDTNALLADCAAWQAGERSSRPCLLPPP